MSAKIELLTFWVLTFIAWFTKNDVIFTLTIIGQVLFILKNLPGAIHNVKQFKKYINARMVKKTD